MRWAIPMFILLLIGCVSEAPVRDEVIKEEHEAVIPYDSSVHIDMSKIGLVDIQLLDSTIQIDLRYAGENNFMGQTLYDTLKWVFLQQDVAERLVLCQKTLQDSMPGYSLLVYDGVRPVQVQQKMWDALDSIPFGRRVKFVSNPALGSIHNYGSAVDLTIVEPSGKPLDMGAGYDDFREIAFPSLEWKFRQSGELSEEQWKNRKLLRWVMRSQKFHGIQSEWWHFNAYDRYTASHKYEQLLSESGHSRWFKPVLPDSTAKDSISE